MSVPLEPPIPSGDTPSLASLRAFEAAARHGSFVAAARELVVTPAAIAQHVKTVERWCGQDLFERSPSGVTLRATVAAALPTLTSGFDQITEAANQLRLTDHSQVVVRIAALPAIAQLWLNPRLADLRSAVPTRSVSVHATDTLPDLMHSPYDASVFYKSDRTPTGASLVGPPDELMMVASPTLAALLERAEQLRNHTLLLDDSWNHHWTMWSQAAGVDLDATTTSTFSLFSMALDSALRGEGFLVARRSLIERAVAAGTLVEPFDIRTPTGDALTIDIHPGRKHDAIAAWAANQLLPT